MNSYPPSPHLSDSPWLAMARVGSFYGLLGVTTEATTEEIKLAFKRRALQVHPDKGTMSEEQKTKAQRL